MIYLDNSATTHKKPKTVIKHTKLALTKYSVNAGRSGYALCVKAGYKVLEIRNQLNDFLGGSGGENVIFTSNCTQAINLALRGSVVKNGHIITTSMEHNSTLRTLNYLKENYNITYTIINPVNHTIRLSDITKAIQPNTYMVAVIHTSNVTGDTFDIEKIGELCSIKNLLFMVDGAQSVGHENINMKKFNINLLAVAGHKGLFAPQSVGALLTNNIKLSPLIFGGTGTFSESIEQPYDSPEGFESGTISLPCIFGLGAGLKYVKKHFFKNNKKVAKLTTYILQELKNNKKIKVYSINHKSGVISFNILGKTSSEVSDILDEKYKICARSGLHCAPLVHKYYNTLQRGMVRISISPYNTKKEIIKTITALNEISNS